MVEVHSESEKSEAGDPAPAPGPAPAEAPGGACAYRPWCMYVDNIRRRQEEQAGRQEEQAGRQKVVIKILPWH